jgi:hypothetical protein
MPRSAGVPSHASFLDKLGMRRFSMRLMECRNSKGLILSLSKDGAGTTAAR